MNISFFFQAEDGIRDVERSRGLGDVYKRQVPTVLLQQYCCNSTVASVLLQQYFWKSTAATVLLQQYCCNTTVATQYCCNNTVATVLLQQYCCNSTVATVLLQQDCCNSTVFFLFDTFFCCCWSFNTSFTIRASAHSERINGALPPCARAHVACSWGKLSMVVCLSMNS